MIVQYNFFFHVIISSVKIILYDELVIFNECVNNPTEQCLVLSLYKQQMAVEG